MALDLLQLAGEPRNGVKAAHCHVEDGLDALLPKAVHDIGRDPGLDGGGDAVGVRAVYKHGDGTAHGAAQAEHILKHVAARVAEVDHDHVRGRVLDPPRDAHERVDEGDTLVPGLTQSRLDHRSASAVLVNDKD